MKRRGLWISGATALLAAALLAFLSGGGGRGPTDASSFSKGSLGWSAARAYLETQGAETETLDEPIGAELPAAGVLVIAGAAAQGYSSEELETLDRFLTNGGRVVFGYPSRSVQRAAYQNRLGLEFRRSAVIGPLFNPFVWRSQAFAERRYETDGAETIRLYAVKEYPESRPEDRVLARNEKREPIVILRTRGRGEILLVPDEVFSNGRLGQSGNAGLLESVRLRFGAETPWMFDEYHHGIVRPTSPLGLKSRRALDLFIFQIVLVYFLFVLATGRRFGPEWAEPQAQSGATSSFLMTIAGMHDRLGHHAAAARVLGQRAKDVLGIEAPEIEQGTGKDILTRTANQLNNRHKLKGE